MFLKTVSALAMGLAFVAFAGPVNAADGDVDKVVEKTLADNPDMKALCGGREASIRPAVTKAVVALATSGAISGDHQATGEAAGGKVTQHCIKFLSGG